MLEKSFAASFRVAAIMVIWLFVSGFGFSSSAPDAWEDWAVSNPENTASIDHSAWTGFLKKYVKRDPDGLNRFAYGSVSAADKAALRAYIMQLEQVQITNYRKQEQLAYWLNLYNAVTVDVVLQHYPVKSIKDIDISGLFKNGPWQKELVKVEGTPLTLDDIEHAILRPIWKDPRIHYGVNCASIGCPNLLPEAFSAKRVEAMLDAAAVDFVNSPRGVAIVDGGDVQVSKIYSWFAHDFGNSERGVLNHVLKYAKPELAAAVRKAGRISDTAYDWKLNE